MELLSIIFLTLSLGKGEATALCIAAQEGHLRAVEVLVNNKAAIEAKDNVLTIVFAKP